MSQVFDSTSVFTRVQSDGRYVQKSQPPSPPTNLALTDTGLATYSGQQLAYMDISFTGPITPSWAEQTPFVLNYSVQLSALGQVVVLNFGDQDPIRIDELIPGLTYKISVATIDYLKQSGVYCAPITARAALDSTPPATPSFTVVSNGTGALITVATLNTEVDFDYYELFRDISPSLKTETSLLPCATFNTKSMTDVGVPTTGSYYYYIRAYDFSGNFSSSSVVGPISLTASPTGVPTEISMAGVLGVANSDGSITISYPSDNDNTITSFHIQRRTLGNTVFEEIATLTPTPVLTYTDTSAVPGLTYFYAITAVNPSGESAIDTVNAVQVTSSQTSPPSPIAGSTITYSGGVGVINVGWTPSTDPNTRTYLVRWRYQQVGQYSIFNVGEETSSSSYQITDLQDPTTGLPPTKEGLANLFEVEIASVDYSGNQSVFVTRVLLGVRSPVQFPELIGYRPSSGVLPAAPTFISYLSNPDGTITLTWVPTSTVSAGYTIEQLETGQAAWLPIQTITDATGGSKSYTVTGLEPYKFRNNQYRFRIRDFDAYGNVSSVNLVENPQFFNGFYSWGYYYIPIGLTTGYSGQNNAPIVSSATSLTGNVPVTPNLNYTFSGYFKAYGGTTGSAYIEVWWQDSNLQPIGSPIGANIQVPTSINWQRYVTTLIAPANAASVNFILQVSTGGTMAAWDQIQVEQSKEASPFGDGKSPWLNAIDTTGPTVYNPNLIVTPGLGLFSLTWTNPITSDYINGVFEIWRKKTASFIAGFVADSSLIKIAEVPAFNDGHSNQYMDTSYDTLNHTSAIYALRGRDRFGNGNSTTGGVIVYLATAGVATTQDVDDKQIATTSSVSIVQKQAVAALASVWVPDPNFDSSPSGLWTAINQEPANAVPAGCPTGYCGQLYARDCLGTWAFTVTVGQKLYFEMYVDTTASNFPVNFGLQFPTSSGITYTPVCSIGRGVSWTKVSGVIAIPSGVSIAYPWLQMSGYSAFGNAYVTGLKISDGIPAQQDVTTLYSNVATINTNVANVNSNIANINTQIANINTQVANITTETANVFVQNSATIYLGNKFVITVS